MTTRLLKKTFQVLIAFLFSVPAAHAQLLYDNGPMFNSAGTGSGGANESVLYTTSFGMSTIGFGNSHNNFIHVADDFVISDCAWRIDSIVFFAYQTGSTTTSTMTGVFFRIWDSIPDVAGSAVIFGDTTTNRLSRTAWSGVYRITETTNGNTARPIMRNVCSIGGVTVPAGTYWIDWSTTGTLASGPWAPARTPYMVSVTGNGRQRIGSTWSNALDGGTGTPAQGFPFIIYGTVLSASADAGTDVAFCYPGTVSLGGSTPGSGNGAITYSWSPVSGLNNAVAGNPQASPASSVSYVLTVSDSMGCTATDTVQVTVNQPGFDTINPDVCGSYLSPAGNTYSSSGTYTDTLQTVLGCDSMITINLVVRNPSSSNLSVSVCDSVYISPSGNMLTSSGTYLDTISNSAGCDSIITIQLAMNMHTSASVNITTCNASYTAPSGQVLTSSGNYSDTIPNVSGCDSVIAINLTLLQSTQSAITANTCGSYTTPSGNIYTSSGTYLDTIPNAAGCDSIITIQLNATVLDTSVQLLNNGFSILCNDVTPGATYEWVWCDNGYSPVPGETNQQFDNGYVQGNFAIIITSGNCVDTSACTLVYAWGIAEQLAGAMIGLYPNPSDGSFTLELPEAADDVLIGLADVTGREIWKMTNQSGKRIHVDAQVQPGTYIVTIRTAGYAAVKNLVIAK